VDIRSKRQLLSIERILNTIPDVAILIGSIGSALLVLFGAGFLLTYIKRIEEKELELRFGQEYLEYKKQTPFLIPRFWQKS
jgi:protein-S-isoprenylcysteine O-methyltransferase Ste14